MQYESTEIKNNYIFFRIIKNSEQNSFLSNFSVAICTIYFLEISSINQSMI